MFKGKKETKLTEEEYVYLDVVMGALKFAGKKTPALEQILKPICFKLFNEYYSDRPAPQVDFQQVNPSGENKSMSVLRDMTDGMM